MFCIHCGKEIADNCKFCPHCGGELQPEKNPSLNSMIDNAGEHIGSGIDEVVSDLKDEFKNGSDTISKTVEQASQHVEDVRNNWRDYLTMDNIELLSALVLALPIFMGIVNAVVGAVFGRLDGIPVIGLIFGIIPFLVRLIFVLAAAAGLAAGVYILMNQPEKRNLWSYITVCGAGLAFLSCLGILFGFEAVPLVAGAACMLYGIDCISRVLLQKKGIDSQPDIVNDVEAYKTWYENYKREHPSDEPDTTTVESQYAYSAPNNSYFDGDGVTLLGLYILTAIVCTVTCGLAFPWMYCKLIKWRKTHTVIDGKRLDFNGTGGSLFGHWILWELLSVITCGIYSFFVHVALKRWEMQHTTYEGQPAGAGDFDGNSFQYFGYGLIQVLLLMISCGLAAPWTLTIIQKWEMRHSIILGDRMRYDGTALGILGQYIIVFLLSMITFGIYSPWGTVRINKYIYSHTHVDR